MFKYDFSQWQKTLYHTNVDEIKSKTDSLVIISLQLYSSISPLPMSSHFPLSSYTCLNSHFKFSKTSTRLSRTPWKHNKNVLISFYINRTVGNIVLFPFSFFFWTETTSFSDHHEHEPSRELSSSKQIVIRSVCGLAKHLPRMFTHKG